MPQPPGGFQQRLRTASQRIPPFRPLQSDVAGQNRTPCARIRIYSTASLIREPQLHYGIYNTCRQYNGTPQKDRKQTSQRWLSSQASIWQTRAQTEKRNIDEVLPIETELERAEKAAYKGTAIVWDDVVLRMENAHGARGAWAVLERMKQREALPAAINSNRLRSAFIRAAVQLPENSTALATCAEYLFHEHDYRWPNLYTKTMHGLLEKNDFKGALWTHLALVQKFMPETSVLGFFFRDFIMDPSPEMQNVLKIMYVSLPRHNLYDAIIPSLYDAGQSVLARSWRRTLVLHGDFPTSYLSRPFLLFLTRYYGNIPLSPKEREVADSNVEIEIGTNWPSSGAFAPRDSLESSAAANLNSEGEMRPLTSSAENRSHLEGIMTKLFASNWTPINFAIRLAKNAGVKSIGARALQALALREDNAEEVHRLIKELRQLDIALPTGAYSIALMDFAKNGKNELLHDLLSSDIHPEEFDDHETRNLILQHSILKQDSRQENLMKGVISAINSALARSSKTTLLAGAMPLKPAFPLEKTLFEDPRRMRFALDRLLSLNFEMKQHDALLVLSKAFAAFPVDRDGIVWNSDLCFGLLDEVVGIVRSVATQDAAVPSEYWKILLLGLCYQGKLDTLEQLSLEIVQLYDTGGKGLYPIHEADLPRNHQLASSDRLGIENTDIKTEQVATVEYIPADLPFNHHLHPVTKIFDASFQRATVRLGFDWALDSRRTPISSDHVHNAIATRFNVACGVRLLANLRDRGVLINEDVVDSAVRAGIRYTQRARQRHGDALCSTWPSTEQMLNFLDLAWGSVLLPIEELSDIDRGGWLALQQAPDVLKRAT